MTKWINLQYSEAMSSKITIGLKASKGLQLIK